MQTNSNPTETHTDDCFTQRDNKPGSLDLGCTCNWTDQDQHDLGRWTN